MITLKLITIAAFTFLITSIFTSIAYAASLNYQGKCSGKTLNGQNIELTYYSDYDGHKKESNAAVVYDNSEVQTGKRHFKGDKDIYHFENSKLKFKNSTGNTSGFLTYLDEVDGKTKRTIELNCEIRDYEYF